MKPVSLEVTMMKRIGELNAEIAYLKSEGERLKNNVAYLDTKLNEELEKSAMLCGQVNALQAELADAQENYHLVNEMVKRIVK